MISIDNLRPVAGARLDSEHEFFIDKISIYPYVRFKYRSGFRVQNSLFLLDILMTDADGQNKARMLNAGFRYMSNFGPNDPRYDTPMNDVYRANSWDADNERFEPLMTEMVETELEQFAPLALPEELQEVATIAPHLATFGRVGHSSYRDWWVSFHLMPSIRVGKTVDMGGFLFIVVANGKIEGRHGRRYSYRPADPISSARTLLGSVPHAHVAVQDGSFCWNHSLGTDERYMGKEREQISANLMTALFTTMSELGQVNIYSIYRSHPLVTICPVCDVPADYPDDEVCVSCGVRIPCSGCAESCSACEESLVKCGRCAQMDLPDLLCPECREFCHQCRMYVHNSDLHTCATCRHRSCATCSEWRTCGGCGQYQCGREQCYRPLRFRGVANIRNCTDCDTYLCPRCTVNCTDCHKPWCKECWEGQDCRACGNKLCPDCLEHEDENGFLCGRCHTIADQLPLPDFDDLESRASAFAPGVVVPAMARRTTVNINRMTEALRLGGPIFDEELPPLTWTPTARAMQEFEAFMENLDSVLDLDEEE